jgi:hypothetical protein
MVRESKTGWGNHLAAVVPGGQIVHRPSDLFEGGEPRGRMGRTKGKFGKNWRSRNDRGKMLMMLSVKYIHRKQIKEAR